MRERMSAADRLIVLAMAGSVCCGALYSVGKLAYYLLYGDGWLAFRSWLAGRPNAVDAAVAAVAVVVLVYAQLRRR